MHDGVNMGQKEHKKGEQRGRLASLEVMRRGGRASRRRVEQEEEEEDQEEEEETRDEQKEGSDCTLRW